jgi:hypothetical protein
VLANAPPAVANKISGLSRLDLAKILSVVGVPIPDVRQPQQPKRRNSLRHCRNKIAASALVIEQHRNTRRSAMRIMLFMLAVFAVTAGSGTRAQAQNYPWCADYAGFGSQNCGFTTIQQCQAALSGNGGFCNANTQYVSPAGAPVSRARSHW